MQSINMSIFDTNKLTAPGLVYGGASSNCGSDSNTQDPCYSQVVYANCTIDPCGDSDDEVHRTINDN